MMIDKGDAHAYQSQKTDFPIFPIYPSWATQSAIMYFAAHLSIPLKQIKEASRNHD